MQAMAVETLMGKIKNHYREKKKKKMMVLLATMSRIHQHSHLPILQLTVQTETFALVAGLNVLLGDRTAGMNGVAHSAAKLQR